MKFYDSTAKQQCSFYEEEAPMMIPEFAQAFVLGFIIFPPFFLIYKKAGFHPGWSALVFLPVFGLLLIFLHLALTPWPNLSKTLEHRP